MTEIDPVKASWQAAASDAALPSLAAVRAQADGFHRKVRRRNAIEYGAAGVVVLCFGAYVLFLPGLWMKLGSALVVLATLLVVWQLHRRASAMATPDRAGLESIMAHQRAQCVRQRDALRNVFWWYELPFVPGLLLILFGRFSLGPKPVTLSAALSSSLAPIAVLVVVFGGIWALNQWAAYRLQKAIDEIDAAGKGAD